ncbi:acid phosphatase (class A) [Flavobacterium sp. 90]|uniref:acid phosphatase n=1 Tax=unclassified Flavobacterium TaxID=196869 RepID=UPI000F1ED45F|nr:MULTISPECIES: phosphatase PAP2 family protein [unclassified Flavobacterium]RKR09522.1 acid phosphatase (class A) [Flavobacterium sp. 81]TCK53306.1 acid phosphatase (class A) [Flavobacterium sp. 90]
MKVLLMRLKVFHIITTLFDKGFKSKNAARTFTNVEQLREIMPDLLHGYLKEDEMPNSLILLAPPPEHTSEAFEFDLEYAKKAVKAEDKIRFMQAAADANLSFPAAVKSFESTLGIEISEAKTPKLYLLMRRVMTDAGLSTYAAKNHYNRERPFVVTNTKTCTPEQEEVLRKVGSFPSGHAAVGWAWALVFSEIFPYNERMILRRGYDFGESRIICNAHWRSDVEMGRVMGRATVDCLRDNLVFQDDLAIAKEEVLMILKETENNA